MLQRIQTIWLLLAATCALLTLKVSFYSGNVLVNNQRKFEYLTAMNGGMLLLIFTVTAAVASLIIIFLYKDRKLQLKLTIAAIALGIINIALFFSATDKYAEGNYDITAPVVIAVPVLLILAAMGMYKDEKLVKSVDRLR